MTDPMELVGRLDELHAILCAQKKHAGIKNGDGNSSDWEPSDRVCNLPKEAAACIRELVGWRPIETAPRGTDIFDTILVIYGEDTPSYHVAYEGWTEDDGTIAWFNGDVRVYPTHWLPLPPAPGAEA